MISRVLFVTRSLPFHQIGGMEAVAWDLARALVKKGIRVSILTTACSKLGANATRDGIDIECLPTRSARYSTKWWRESTKAIRSRYWNEVDVVFSVSIGAFGAIPFADSRKRPLFVSQVHGTAWGEFRSKFGNPSVISWLKAVKNLLGLPGELKYRKIDAQIAIGEKVLQELSLQPARFIRRGCKTFLIPNGIDEAVFSFSDPARGRIRAQLGISPSAKVVISTSRLHAQKGVALAIKAFSLAMKDTPSLKMLILGDGPEAESLKAQALHLGLSDSIYFVGPVNREEMKGYLSAADIFIFTTVRVEGLPLNLLEALSAGLPCIISDHISDPQFDTINVDPRDSPAIAGIIGGLISEQLGSRSSKLPSKFTLEHAVEEYISVLNSLRVSRFN